MENKEESIIKNSNPFDVRTFLLAGKAFIETAQTILVSFAITAFIYVFLAIPNQVEGASMETNFHNGDLLITNKLIQILNSSGIGESISYEYVRGDVIIFQQAGKSDFIKRIIAEEGDTIKFEDTNVIINNKLIIENYLEEGIQTKLPNSSISFLNEGEEVTVPQGKYFVMGDNREHSQDSRFKSVGWVDQDEIKGRVFLKYWPITEISLIPRGDFEELNISEE